MSAMKLVGWRHVVTGAFWSLPDGYKPPEYTVDEAWEPVYSYSATRDFGALPTDSGRLVAREGQTP